LFATANYFDVLRARPVLGRGFLPGEDSVAGREPVAVILAFDIWVPLTMHAPITGAPALGDDWTIRWLFVFGRLSPGSTLESARAAAQVMGTRLATLHPANQDRGITVTELDVGPTQMLKPLFVIMLAITVLVLLIVCTNVANLLMLRGAAREHELAVRLALGAQRTRIVRQLMTESFVLAIAGVLLGLLIAQWAQGSFGAFFPDSPLPVTVETSLNARVIAILTAVGASTVFIFGLAPALRTARGAERIKLTGGTRGTTAGGAKVRGALVGAQFALSLAVIVAAGIFIRRLDELERIDRGFRDPQEIVLTTVDFELAGGRDDATNPQTVERILERVRTIPGVRAAAAATFVPLGFIGYSTRDIRVEGYVPGPGESMTFLMNRVSDSYFTTMEIRIVRGREIDPTDRSDALGVMVVNEAFARRFWNTNDAVGRMVQVGGRDLTVVGIAADGKYEFSQPLDEPSPPFMYVPLAQWPSGNFTLHVRGGSDPLTLLPAIRREVSTINPRLPVLSPTTLESYSSVPFFPLRIGSTVLTFLGGAALVLAALGLYAVIGYAVLQRQREIGVRLALGASPRRVVVGFLIEAARYAGIGAVAGLLLAMALTRLLGSSVPYLMPRDAGGRALPFLVAVLVLTAVALIAALIPARRATLVSPTTALRAE
jgi:predicted permease